MFARWILAGLAVLAAAPAIAQAVPPGKEGALKAVLPPKPGTQICFSRSYDAAHLKAHPNQIVTDIEFRLAYHRFEPDENFPDGQRNYYFDLLARKRGEGAVLQALGECSVADGKIFCGVECDGGGIYLKKVAGDAITLSFDDMWGIRMTSGCDDSEQATSELSPGTDDKVFKLTQAGTCPAYEKW